MCKFTSTKSTKNDGCVVERIIDPCTKIWFNENEPIVTKYLPDIVHRFTYDDRRSKNMLKNEKDLRRKQIQNADVLRRMKGRQP